MTKHNMGNCYNFVFPFGFEGETIRIMEDKDVNYLDKTFALIMMRSYSQNLGKRKTVGNFPGNTMQIMS